MVGKDGMVGAFAALDGISVNRGIVQLSGTALTCKTSELRARCSKANPYYQRCFGMSKRCMHRQANRLLAWLLTGWRSDFADGFFEREI
jgi:hypothetical protein